MNSGKLEKLAEAIFHSNVSPTALQILTGGEASMLGSLREKQRKHPCHKGAWNLIFKHDPVATVSIE